MKTVLLGLDGATFSILDPLMDHGVMPFLKSFMDRGARCDLHSTALHLTPVAWTSMVTGMLPGNTGIFDFIRVSHTADGPYLRLVDSRDIQCETVWSMVHKEGLRVTSLNFPVTFPAPAV